MGNYAIFKTRFLDPLQYNLDDMKLLFWGKITFAEYTIETKHRLAIVHVRIQSHTHVLPVLKLSGCQFKKSHLCFFSTNTPTEQKLRLSAVPF